MNLSNAAATAVGVVPGDRAGSSVASGDLNDDGAGDLLVGAPRSDAGGNDSGAAYLLQRDCPARRRPRRRRRRPTKTTDSGRSRIGADPSLLRFGNEVRSFHRRDGPAGAVQYPTTIGRAEAKHPMEDPVTEGSENGS
ncbi:integrin alpha [Halorussus salinisoli]|uniref:integrin alpha n=1 Tax=Halorussus salinisoli TaxID=2558242 RepID=UPI00148546FF|nr:integrin alpha [Halorussus salinisoli]